MMSDEKPLRGRVYRHSKSGGRYMVLEPTARLEATGESVVVYTSLETGQVWVRPEDEFRERFTLQEQKDTP